MKRLTATKWYCAYNPSKQGYDLFFSVQFGNGNPWYNAQDITFIERKEFGEYPNPLFTLNENQAQELIDALWTSGLRPTEGHGSVGQIGAVERHLEDMRTIVFDSIQPTIKSISDTFILIDNGKMTVSIPYDASVVVIQTALDALRGEPDHLRRT